MTPSIILFDGICNFCNGWVNFIIKQDKKKSFRFAALQSVQSKQLLEQYHIHFTSLDTFVLIENGKYYTKSTAALKVFRNLGLLWSMLHIFMLVPGFIRDAFYDIIARNRYRWFGKKEHCMIPN